MDRETMDPSQGKKTTIHGTMDPPEGEKTKFMDQAEVEAKVKEFIKNYFSTFEANRADVANLYREGAVITFGGEKIWAKEDICAKLKSVLRLKVVKIECLPVGGTGLYGGTGFSSGLQGLASGYIWLDGKQDARFFSQMFILHPTPEGSFDIADSILFTGPESSGTASSTRPLV